MIASYLDQMIMFLVGVWASGVGYEFISAPGKDPVAQLQWKSKFSKTLKIIGPLLISISVLLAVATFFGFQ